LRRLREHQLVTIEVSRPSASIECLVLAIDGDEATLEPVDPMQLPALSVIGRDALLTFEYRSQLITLRGSARRDEVERDLRFAVTDRVMVPQRRQHARVDVALTVTITPLDDRGPPIRCEARVIRHVGGGTGMRYTSIGAEDRGRLKQFVAAYKRAVLANLRKQER
jgi:hypothetical protein